MKIISIKEITMTNFKGLSRTTKFNSVGSTTICGDNGIGKSRHFDAFLWLLFGKDSKDRKDYEIRTRVNGQLLHKVECSVSAIITVNGESISLKRSYTEKWVKPHGQADEVFKGNITECTWNDVPVNVTEYDKRVATIIDGTVFKMITNPHFFTSMKWDEQRQQLFNMIDTVSDEDIASADPKFKALLDNISGKSLSDFKKELAATKKRLKEELIQINPRIDQTYKMMPEKKDFASLEKELEEVNGKIKLIDKSINDYSETLKNVNLEKEKISKQIFAEKESINSKLREAQNKYDSDTANSNKKHSEIVDKINSLHFDIDAKGREIKTISNKIEICNNDISCSNNKLTDLRLKWQEVNSKEFNGETTCPHCGQQLPEEMIIKAEDLFKEEKKRSIDEINRKGQEENKVMESYKKDLENYTSILEKTKKDIDSLNSELETKQKELDGTEFCSTVTLKIEELPEYAEYSSRIKELQDKLDNYPTPTNEDLTGERNDLSSKKSELLSKLDDKDRIEKSEKEISYLEDRGRSLSQQIADLEKQEFAAKEFTKAKIDACETKINSLFKITTFKLFDYTLDGNTIETCKALDRSGVPYDTTNTAQQINMGIDIINALSKYYGVSAPIFIDRRESVNNLIDTQSQIINLVVTKDKELIVK